MPILKNIFIRIFSIMITLTGVAIIVFFVIRVVPGNPISMMLPPGATEDDILRLKALYGFDKTIIQQFFIWINGVLHGDFGDSISLRQPVLSLVLGRLPATLELSIMALIIACLLGGLLALLGTRLIETKTEGVLDIINGMAPSVPDFLWGLVFILLFGVMWPIFHISGRISPSIDMNFLTQFYLLESIVRLDFKVFKPTEIMLDKYNNINITIIINTRIKSPNFIINYIVIFISSFSLPNHKYFKIIYDFKIV